MQPQSALAANLWEGRAQDWPPNTEAALEASRQQAHKLGLRVSVPCSAHEAQVAAVLRVPLGVQSALGLNEPI